jgi:protein-disulfide isomerase
MKPTQWIPVRRHITWVRAFRFVPAARFGLLAIAIGLAGCTSPSDRELQRMVLRVDSLAQAVTALGRASGRGAVAARAIRPAGTRITGALREGDPTSPFVLVEFTDYFCPFCATWAVSMLPELTGQYAQKAGLEVVVRNYPIKEIHPHAMRVASLVECARDALPAAGWKLYRSFYARGETLDSAV